MRLVEAANGTGTNLVRSGRQAILHVEDRIKQLAQLKLHTEHRFAPGVYARTLYIPKGTLLSGRVHKHEHFNIVLAGTIEVMTEDGYRKVGAGSFFKSPVAVKRIGFAHEDTIWTTIHANPTEERDPEKLQDLLTVASYEDLEEHIIEGEFTE